MEDFFETASNCSDNCTHSSYPKLAYQDDYRSFSRMMEWRSGEHSAADQDDRNMPAPTL